MTPRSTFTVLLFATLLSSLSTLQAAFTTAATPSDGVYRFTFGVNETGDGSFAVPASAAYDVRGTYDAANAFTYGFLGTRDGSYADDVPASPSCAEPSAIDGFQVVQGQKIVLHDTNDLNNVACVCGPAASEYLPAGAKNGLTDAEDISGINADFETVRKHHRELCPGLGSPVALMRDIREKAVREAGGLDGTVANVRGIW